MRQLNSRKKFFILSFGLLFVLTCSSGSKSPTEPETPPVVIKLTSLGGQAQKGPFNNGTIINIAELNSSLSPTGKNFTSQILDNSGLFSVPNIEMQSAYAEIRATGFYFDEVNNKVSNAQLVLLGLTNLTNKTSMNVNIISHLEYQRLKNLISNNSSLSFASAKTQALTEVLNIFDFGISGMPESVLLDITKSGLGNARLLAISAIIQDDRSTGQVSELLANISTDIATDGVLNNSTIKSQLMESASNLDVEKIRENLESRYQQLEMQVSIPNFEQEVSSFLKPPTAFDISVSTNEDSPISITLNAQDSDDSNLTFSTLEVNNATVTINGNTASYIPNPNWSGVDTFTYYASDNYSNSNVATVTVTVGAIDDEPSTQDISTSTDEDIPVSMTLTAEEYDGQSYSFSIVNNPSNGTVSLSGAQATYQPDSDWNGVDTFTFQATDDRYNRLNIATATITVNPVNDAPTANDISVELDESKVGRGYSTSSVIVQENRDIFSSDLPVKKSQNFSSSQQGIDITLEGEDVDGDDLTYQIITNPSNGSISLNNNVVTYNPDENWNGTDAFSYSASDGEFESNTASVNLTVNAVNDAPTTENLSITLEEDTSVDIQLVGSDVEGSSLSFSIVTDPSNGSLSLNGSVVTYSPNSGYFGEDSFTYNANDGELESNISTVSLTITEFNNPPVTQDISVSIDENRTQDRMVGITLLGSDEDGDELTYSLVSEPANGTASISGEVLTYLANQDWNGVETFTYKANDGDKDSNISTITVTVNAINDVPIANDQSIEVISNSVNNSFPFDVEDVDDNQLNYTITNNPSNGTITLLPPSNFEYTPNTNYVGYDSFSYTVSDESGASAAASVTITVDGDMIFTYPVEEGTILYGGQTIDITWTGGTGDQPSSFGDKRALTLQIINNQGQLGSDIFSVSESGLNSCCGTLINPTTFRFNIPSNGIINGTQALTHGELHNLRLLHQRGDQYDPSIQGEDSVRFTFESYSATFTNPSSNGTPKTFSVGTPYTITWMYSQGKFPSPKFVLEENTEWGTSNEAVWEERFSENLSAEATSYIWTPQSGLIDNENFDLPAHYRFRIVDDSIPGEVAAETSNFYIDNDVQFDGIRSPINGTTVLLGLTVDIVWRGGFPNTGIELIDRFGGADEEKILDIATNINSNYYTIGAVNENTTTYSWTIPTDLEPKNSYSIRVYDASEDGEESAVSSTAIQENNPPTTSDISVSGDEDNDVSIGLAGSDVDGAVMLYSIISQPTNGTVNISPTRPNNSISYTPNTNWNGTDTFTYKANDYIEDSNVSTVTIAVNPVNDAPVSNDYSNNVAEGQSQDFPISNLGSDIDNNDDDLSVVLTSNPSYGTFQRKTNTNKNNYYEYVPTDSNFIGTESFTFKLNDGSLLSNESTITFIYSNADNDLPSVNDVTATTDEDVAVDINLNGSDPDGDNLTYSVVSDPLNGSVVFGVDKVTYTPSANYNGTDTFTYKANDGTADSNTATITISIASVNDEPFVFDITKTIAENRINRNQRDKIIDLEKGENYQIQSINGSITIELNGIDVDGDSLIYSIESTNAGFVNLDGNQVSYTPSNDWNGVDSFEYRAFDGQLQSNIGTVVVRVNPENDAPIVEEFKVNTFEDVAISFQFKGSDIDNDNLTYTIQSLPTGGNISQNNHLIEYTPYANWFGVDQLSYVANDGSLDSNIGTVDIIVQSLNDAPTANHLSYNVTETKTSNKTLYAFSGEDVDGDQLTYSVTSNVKHGQLSINESYFNYIPSTDFVGVDSLQYIANDGKLDSNVATILLNVEAVNDAPVVQDIYKSIDEDTTLTIELSATDVDSETINFAINTLPSNGTISISDNFVTYVPTDDFYGVDSFKYFAQDNNETVSNIGTVNIVVNPMEDAPKLEADSVGIYFTLTQPFPEAIGIALPTKDPDDDPVTYAFQHEEAGIAFFSTDYDSIYFTGGVSRAPGTYTSFIYGIDAKGNKGASVPMTANFYGGSTGLTDVQEWTAGWKENNELRDPAVSYVPWASLGTTGYIIENRAGDETGVNYGSYVRDFDRFDYWTKTGYWSIELDFSHPSLAWNYASNNVESYVPFTMYAVDNISDEKIPLFAAFYDLSGDDTFDIDTDGDGAPVWQGPVYSADGWDPIYGYFPFDTTGDGVIDYYDTTDADGDGVYDSDTQYIIDNNAFTSGGIGWGWWSSAANPDHYQDPLPTATSSLGYSITVEYPFVTAMMFTDYFGHGVLPDEAGIASGVYNASNWTGASSIVFRTNFTYYDTPEGRIKYSSDDDNKNQFISDDGQLPAPKQRTVFEMFRDFDSNAIEGGIVEP